MDELSINVEERKELSEKIAEYLFLNETYSIHYIQLLKFCHSLNFEKYGIETFDYELRTCNFMRRDAQGNYSFVHKSFLEYILSSIIFDQLFSKSKINTKWGLPLEEYYLKSSAKTATKETQDFFMQSMESKLLHYTSEDIMNICNNDYRKEKIFISAIQILKNKTFGVFFTKHILKESLLIDNYDNVQILDYIINAYDFELCIDFLCKQVSEINIEEVKKIYHDLILNGIDENRLKNLYTRIKIFEKETEDILTKHSDKSYPFRKEIFKLRLDALLEGVEDIEEIGNIKTNFKRNWIKEKAEYDQKVKRNQNAAKKEEKDKYKL